MATLWEAGYGLGCRGVCDGWCGFGWRLMVGDGGSCCILEGQWVC